MGYTNEFRKHGFTQKRTNITHGARTVSGVTEVSGESCKILRELRDSISGADAIREVFICKGSQSLKGDWIKIMSLSLVSLLLSISAVNKWIFVLRIESCFKNSKSEKDRQTLGRNSHKAWKVSGFPFKISLKVIK